jgi:hypothetical protein
MHAGLPEVKHRLADLAIAFTQTRACATETAKAKAAPTTCNWSLCTKAYLAILQLIHGLFRRGSTLGIVEVVGWASSFL